MMKRAIPSRGVLQTFFLKNRIIHELEEHRRWVERIMFILGLISATMAIPQIMAICVVGDSSQVSLTAWTFYAFANAMWIGYAFVFRRPVVQRVHIIYLLSNLAVVSTVVYFR
jgi:uncharacterized protein with PQ loop repeat